MYSQRRRSAFVIGASVSAIFGCILVALPAHAQEFVAANGFAGFASTTQSLQPAASSEAQVRAYFADLPVMVAIAQCESRFRQFNTDGTVLLGGGGGMVGIFQIAESIHKAVAAPLGFDITTIAGNMGYARYLYGSEGTTPWIDSFPCWNALVKPSTTSAADSTQGMLLSKDLSLGMIDQQVVSLQQLLNSKGYMLASDGPGSPGQETSKFGALTLQMVKKFQCAQGIVCSGDAYSTGYGLVNAATRSALMLAATSSQTTAADTALAQNQTASAATAAHIEQLKSQITALMAILQQLLAQRGAGAL